MLLSLMLQFGGTCILYCLVCMRALDREAEVSLTKFLADLVNATSDCVQVISDLCLAKGLISGSTYRKVLESGGISGEKARLEPLRLNLGVQKSTKRGGGCFDILLEILDEQLPPASKQKLLLEMRRRIGTKECQNGTRRETTLPTL